MKRTEKQVEQINKTIEILEKVISALKTIRDTDCTETRVLRDLDLDCATFRRICYENDWLTRSYKKNKDSEYVAMRESYKDHIPTRDWTEDLFCVIMGIPRGVSSCGKFPSDVKETVLKAIETVTPREKDVLLMLFRDNMSMEEVGEEFDLTKERIRQIEAKALRKLRHPNRMCYLVYGDEYYVDAKKIPDEMQQQFQFDKCKEELERLESLIHTRRNYLNGNIKRDLDLDRDIATLDLSVRSYNCLTRQGIWTIRELLTLSKEQLKGVRNLGKKSYDEIIDVLSSHGYALADPNE